jgi:lipopolysaccharide transport system ATP-binding protein
MVTDNLVKDSVQPPQDNDEDIVISVEGVSKKFCRDLKKSLWYGIRDMGGELIGGSQEGQDLRPSEFWALQDVSLQLRKGEALGLVGPNGSGKTTLLRMIAGLIKPDSGKITVKGRIAPLLAAGVGFNPILTGRENIYANMSILGLSKQEIDDRFDDVVAFAEIPHAIEAPVRSYSSGMKARLGFACAIHVEPEILLLDEVLAVGDVKFRGKCYRRLEELNKKGVSFVLVSHNPEGIVSVCDQAVYLLSGQPIAYDRADKIINKYERDLFLPEGVEKDTGRMALAKKSAEESPGADIIEVFFRDAEGNKIDTPLCGEYAVLCVRCFAHREINEANLKLHFKAHGGASILYLTNFNDQQPLTLKEGENEIQLIMPNVGFIPGVYVLRMGLMDGYYGTLDTVEFFSFVVDNNESNINITRCQFYQNRKWRNVNSKDYHINR